jgi:hypothetical protein
VQEKGVAAGLIKVKLDAPTAMGISEVALYPHEIPQINEPKPEKPPQAKGLKEWLPREIYG